MLPFAQWTVNPRAVFANNELDMADIEVYGFDYDYTLAVYKWEMSHWLYERALHRLVEKLKASE